jgi:hypothetical protein
MHLVRLFHATPAIGLWLHDQEARIFCRRWTQMDADIPVLWVRDWLNSRISLRTIRVHLRPSAAKNLLPAALPPRVQRVV